MLVFIESVKQKLKKKKKKKKILKIKKKKKKKNDIYYKLYNIYIKKIDRYY